MERALYQLYMYYVLAYLYPAACRTQHRVKSLEGESAVYFEALRSNSGGPEQQIASFPCIMACCKNSSMVMDSAAFGAGINNRRPWY